MSTIKILSLYNEYNKSNDHCTNITVMCMYIYKYRKLS